MNAKGLKCRINEHNKVTNKLIINEGEFLLNTSYNAVHSDYNITIIKGTVEIITKDEDTHTDQCLVLGEKDQEDNSLLNIAIGKRYEVLEGSQVYIYSALDDKINAARDTDENSKNDGGIGPGGNNGGWPGGNNGGGMGPGGNMGFWNLQMNSQCFIFHIYIYEKIFM